TIKSGLALTVTDYDDILTNAIRAVSARFDQGCNRTLARTVNALHEFNADETELRPACYPVEGASKFELKLNETEGWSEQSGVWSLIRTQCVVSLVSPLYSSRAPCLWRLTSLCRYFMPGMTPAAGEACLPVVLTRAAAEELA